MGNDPTSKRFGENWVKLTKDLLFDSEGGLKFKPNLWNDIRKVIVSTLVDKADMRGVAFYFRKKTGIKMTDSGLADVVLGGEGLTATVHLDKDKSSKLRASSSRLTPSSSPFTTQKNDFLYKTPKPLATALVKKQIQKGLITAGMEYVYGQLVGVRDCMARAKATGGESHTKVLQEVTNSSCFSFNQRYHTAYQMFHQKDESSAYSTTSSIRHSQFKVVHNKWNSILDTGHPAGLVDQVNRTTEREGTALKGQD